MAEADVHQGVPRSATHRPVRSAKVLNSDFPDRRLSRLKRARMLVLFVPALIALAACDASLGHSVAASSVASSNETADTGHSERLQAESQEVPNNQVQASGATDSADYRLYIGAGEEPCESILANLKSLGGQPPLTEMCDVPYDRRDSRFERIAWRTLEPADNVDLIKEIFLRAEFQSAWISIYRASNPRAADPRAIVEREYWGSLRPKVLAGFASGSAQLQEADVDVDNDGEADHVIRMTSWTVTPPPAVDHTRPVADRDVVFSERCYPGASRYRYLRRSELNPIYSSAGMSQYLPFDSYLFRFEGKTYFGLSTSQQSLTFKGAGKGPSFFLEGDHDEPNPKRCGIISTGLAAEP